MRTQSSKQKYLKFSAASSLNIVNEYREKYDIVSAILEANPELLSMAHRDWEIWLSTSNTGRDGYTSEQLLRALIVMFLEEHSYRRTVILIDNSEFLQYFVRLGIKSTMDFTFLNKAYSCLQKETLDKMNGTAVGHDILDFYVR